MLFAFYADLSNFFLLSTRHWIWVGSWRWNSSPATCLQRLERQSRKKENIRELLEQSTRYQNAIGQYCVLGIMDTGLRDSVEKVVQ